MTLSLPRIAFTTGDVNGIGIGVMAKALVDARLADSIEPVVVGAPRVVEHYLHAVPVPGVRVDGDELVADGVRAPIVPVGPDARIAFGEIATDAGELAGRAIDRAVRLAVAGEVDGVVTMPISKQALHLGGFDFPGHTEMIASITGGDPMMILMTEGLLVALVTIHVPIAAVPEMIRRPLIEQRVRSLDATLRRDFGIPRPRIAVLGLNPHAGEGGEIGSEEITQIIPALNAMRAEGIEADGPLPADAFFARFAPGRYDGVLAMYHDQGLIPLKFYARGGGVNYTANLPIVRTSPDHGTAFDIAGRGIADHTSVVEATLIAAAVAARRGTSGGNRAAEASDR
jgi:4-hydroxythreonine-4-phosphate dehydrogenase